MSVSSFDKIELLLSRLIVVVVGSFGFASDLDLSCLSVVHSIISDTMCLSVKHDNVSDTVCLSVKQRLRSAVVCRK